MKKLFLTLLVFFASLSIVSAQALTVTKKTITSGVAAPKIVKAADLNKDTLSDIISVNNGSDAISVYLADTGRTFKAPLRITIAPNISAVDVFDINNDNTKDIVVVTNNKTFTNVYVLLGKPLALGTYSTAVVSSYTATGTYNTKRAGITGVVAGNLNSATPTRHYLVTTDKAGTVSSLRSAAVASPTYTTVVGSYGSVNASYIALGDFNSDSKNDIAVSYSDNNAIAIFYGDNTGAFGTQKNIVLDRLTGSITGLVADTLNADTYTDLAVSSTGSYGLLVMLTDSANTFPTTNLKKHGLNVKGTSIAIGDFNADSKFDLAVSNSNNTVTVYYNGVAGAFTLNSTFSVLSSPQSITVGDFDHDGKQDMAVACFIANTIHILYHN